MTNPPPITPNKAFIRRIVKHYLRYDKENPFIFISGILAFLGIATGVMVLMIAMGIMNGTQKEFEKKLFVMNYPITVLPLLDDSINDSLIDKIKQNVIKLKDTIQKNDSYRITIDKRNTSISSNEIILCSTELSIFFS